MTDNHSEAPEDIGAPQSYLVLKDGTAAYDRSGSYVGTVEHVLADDGSDIFHGLVLDTPDGHRFAGRTAIDGIFANGVVLAVPRADLPEPGKDAAAHAAEDQSLSDGLRRAWDWLIQPR